MPPGLPPDVIDPAANLGRAHDLEDVPDPETEGLEIEYAPALEDDPGDPGDDYDAPAPFTLELVFASTSELNSPRDVWRRANELIESAEKKGLVLSAGQVYGAPADNGQATVENALAQLAELERGE